MYTLPGTLNMMWNILRNGTLSLRWERPTWDTRNIVTQVKINCSDSDYVIIAETSISDFMIILTGLNLNTTVTCCHTLVTSMNETGPQKCVKYPSQRIIIEGKLNCYVYMHVALMINNMLIITFWTS